MTNSVPPDSPRDSAPPLIAHDVRVVLGGVPVLRGVSLQVQTGEAVALLGGNGSGKSTFLRAALGLVPLTHGTIDLFGTTTARFRQWQRIGYVPQRSPGALRGATVGEVVGSGRLTRRLPFVPATKKDRAAVAVALAQVDLTDRRHHEMTTLSGGQQQRALIARALVSEPDLLVLDEPTAGVDLEHQEVLAQLVHGLLAQGRSMLVVLHEVGPLGALLDRTVSLRGGRVIEADLGPQGFCHTEGTHPAGLLSGDGLTGLPLLDPVAPPQRRQHG